MKPLCIFVLFAGLSSVAHAGVVLTPGAQPEAQRQAASPQPAMSRVSATPIIEPDQEPALVRAKATLRKAQAHLELHASGEPLAAAGFRASYAKLEPMRTRNELAIAIPKADGTTESGFVLEMATSSRADAQWVPVFVKQNGEIGDRLFGGPDSVFAKATGFKPETLAAASRADLKSPTPIDTASAAMAQKQRDARASQLKLLPAPSHAAN